MSSGILTGAWGEEVNGIRKGDKILREWECGSAKGLKGIGDLEEDVEWSNHKASLMRIVNNQGQPCTVRYSMPENAVVKINGRTIKVKETGNDRYKIPSKAGDIITIEMQVYLLSSRDFCSSRRLR